MKPSDTALFIISRFIISLLLLCAISPVLSAQQTFIFSQTISGREVIFSANVDFSNIKQLTNSDKSCQDPQISPDGKYIAYFKGNDGSPMDLWVMNTDGTGAKRLTYDSINYGSHPSWHPDGVQILYELASGTDRSESSIRIIKMSGKNDRLLFNNVNYRDRFPCVNPAKINKVAYHYDPGNWEYFSQIRIRDLSSGQDEILVDNNGWADGPFAFSPDGNLLLWSEKENGDEMRLRTINLTTMSIQTISSVKGENCLVTGKFDTTGNYIFYLRRSGTEITEIMRCRSDGSSPAVLYTGNNINSFNVIPGEPVAVYLFNGNAKDIMYGNDGTVYNAVSGPNRLNRWNGAYWFNGANSYISVPHNSFFNFGTGDFSVFTFVKLDAIPSDRADIVSKHNTSASYDNDFFIRIAGITGKPVFGLTSGEGSTEWVNGDSSILTVNYPLNDFHSICGVRENGQIKLYVDAELVDSAQSTINPDNTNPLNIGRSSYNNGYGYFNGKIDDVRIYSRALSDKEITSLHQEGIPNPEASGICMCDTCDYAVEWLSPVESPLCGFTDKQPVKIRISNHGNDTANCVTVSYSINNDSSRVTEKIETVILPDSSLEYTFKELADVTAAKPYYCSGKVSFIGYDTNPDNDISRIRLYNNRRKILVETAESQCNQATGMAIISGVINGVQPYTILWSDGQTTSLADNLASGIYMVTVTDSEGCSDTKSATIDEIGGPRISAYPTITDNPCYGMNEGAIDITVFGITPPYSYEWSNGAITEDLNSLAAGTYQVTITDKAGCKKYGSFDIHQSSPLRLDISSANSSADADDGSAEVIVYGGTPPYNYVWSTDNTSPTLNNLGGGTYQVIVTDANGCSDSASATILQLCGPDIVVNSVTPSECGLSNGMIDISIPGNNGPFEYQWSNGDTVQDLTSIPSGDYSVTVAYKDSTCASVATITIPALLDPVPICMVSVDTITGHNVVVWQKPVSTGNISAFNIYRESDRYEVYEKIGTRTINEESFFMDEDPMVNTAIQAWKYKLSVVDTCGNESELSGEHKTLHLMMSEGLGNTINLIWDNYSGFDYYTCHIYRLSSQNGLENIFNKAGSPQLIFNSFTDLTPPETGKYYYFIEIESPYTCTSEKKATSHNSVRSNTAKKSTTGIINPEANKNLRHLGLYPNPNSGTFTFSFELAKEDNIIFKIFDTYGRLLMYQESDNITGKHIQEVNLSDKSPGVYYLQVIMGDTVISKPFIIE
jgi:hypothetical protein